MELTFTPAEDYNVLRLRGELNTAATTAIQDEIDKIAGIKDKDLVIDCSELSYMGSAGLRQLLTLLKATKANGLSLTLKSVQPSVKAVLKITNLDKIFNIV